MKIGKQLLNHKLKDIPKFWFICLDCGKSKRHLNKDGECKECVIETNKNRERFLK